MGMSERRLESRFLCADLVKVSWSEPAGIRTVEAVLEDISHVGGSVQVEEAIPVGVEIELAIGEWIFRGQVCYCTYREYGYFAGIRFSEQSAWSSDQVIPQHLINLQALSSRTGEKKRED
jgi:hypothetical protein